MAGTCSAGHFSLMFDLCLIREYIFYRLERLLKHESLFSVKLKMTAKGLALAKFSKMKVGEKTGR